MSLLNDVYIKINYFQATDPENDPVRYSITSGNDLRQFTIGSKSGVISVIRKLDREDLTRYQLVRIIILYDFVPLYCE